MARQKNKYYRSHLSVKSQNIYFPLISFNLPGDKIKKNQEYSTYELIF